MNICHVHHILFSGSNQEMKVGDAVLEKHVLGREHKQKQVAVEDLNPYPLKHRDMVKKCVDKIQE